MFFEKTGRGAGRFDFDKWLNEQGWYKKFISFKISKAIKGQKHRK